jgi:hypothetical protein
MRPQNENLVEEVVNRILGTGSENLLFRNDFINSLKAAFTKEEVEEQVTELNCSVTVSQHLGIDYLMITNF